MRRFVKKLCNALQKNNELPFLAALICADIVRIYFIEL